MASKGTKQHGARKTARRTSRGSDGAKGRAASSRSRASSSRMTPSRGRGSRAPSLTWWVVLIAVAAAVWTYYPVLKVHYREEKQKARLEVELEDLRSRNQRLRAQVDRLKTPEGVEDAARESLGLVKAGERAYVVMETTEAPTVSEPDRVKGEDDSVWVQVLDAVFGVAD